MTTKLSNQIIVKISLEDDDDDGDDDSDDDSDDDGLLETERNFLHYGSLNAFIKVQIRNM